MALVGWRDPYIFETKSKDSGREWGMLLGSGIKGKGGSVMIYRSKNLKSGRCCYKVDSQDSLRLPIAEPPRLKRLLFGVKSPVTIIIVHLDTIPAELI